jgi:hypothetical protein
MTGHVEGHCCFQMQEHLSRGEVAIVYVDHFREYGVRILDGGTSFQLMTFCPWCGCKLPPSVRDAWFEKLDELGLEPEDPAVPEEMKSDSWWRRQKP